MANPFLTNAIFYAEKMGFSVIPIIPGQKKPMIKWEAFQKRKATKLEITSWWMNEPNANIGIVTGEISDLFVVDIDSDEGHENLNQLGFDSIIVPAVKTPRGGQHLYFRYPKGSNITIGAGKIPGTDFRGNGGYVLAPPSVNGNGKAYEWVINLDTSLGDAIPLSYINKISTYRGNVDNSKTTSQQMSTMSTNVNNVNIWEHGVRDENLFHVAWSLAKAGNDKEYVFQTLRAIMQSWGENDERWIRDKVESAWKRKEGKERNLTEEVREWILSTSDNFLSTDVNKCLHLSTREEQKTLSVILKRMCDEGLIEKLGNKRGQFRVRDREEEIIDFLNANTTPINLRLPLHIHEWVAIHPGNVIVVAGESNAGKSAFCLNTAKMNCYDHKVNYMSSEMQDGSELRIRLEKFGEPLENWKRIKFTFRTDNFPDRIDPDGLNIVDYLDEGTDAEAYKMPMRIRQIADRLKGGVAVIAIQKDPNKGLGFGGSGTMNRSRLYLTMTRQGVIKIEKGKIWRQDNINPNGMYCKFKLIGGAKFTRDGDWLT